MIPYNPDLAEVAKFPVTVEGESDPTWVTYEQFTCNLVAPMDEKDNIHHMATGIAGEGGELLDCSKKTWVYKKPLDRANMIEELGDLEWYMAGLRQMLGVSRYEILASNVQKLQSRYKNGYTDQAAIDRADKNPPQIVDEVGTPIQGEQLHIIDMGQKDGKNDTVDSDVQPAATVPAPAPEIQDWVQPLIAAYHGGKEVSAIAYTKNTATVLFVGDNNPYKLYRPKGEI